MKLKGINNYCILDIIQPEAEMKKGLISLPANSQATPRWAKVLSTGPGVMDGYGKLRIPDVNDGETVYVMAHGQYSIHNSRTKDVESLAAASVLDIMVVLEDLETMKFKPLGSLIEIEKIEIDQVSENGIELPDDRKSPTNLGRVITVGVGWTGAFGDPIPMQVKVGDKVVYSPLRTMIVDFSTLGKDEKRFVINHGDIIALVEED